MDAGDLSPGRASAGVVSHDTMPMRPRRRGAGRLPRPGPARGTPSHGTRRSDIGGGPVRCQPWAQGERLPRDPGAGFRPGRSAHPAAPSGPGIHPAHGRPAGFAHAGLWRSVIRHRGPARYPASAGDGCRCLYQAGSTRLEARILLSAGPLQARHRQSAGDTAPGPARHVQAASSGPRSPRMNPFDLPPDRDRHHRSQPRPRRPEAPFGTRLDREDRHRPMRPERPRKAASEREA